MTVASTWRNSRPTYQEAACRTAQPYSTSLIGNTRAPHPALTMKLV